MTLPYSVILDTGAGPNHISKRTLPTEWHDRMKFVDDSAPMAATKQAVKVEGAMLLHVSIGDLSVRVCFGVVTTLAVQLLFGTSFFDRFVKAIFPKERQIVPQH